MIYTDWKGNEIKDGHEICIIKTKLNPFFSKVGFFIPGTGESKFVDVANKDCWIIDGYSKVFDNNGTLYVTTNNSGSTITSSLSTYLSWAIQSKDFLIGIKGLSDKNS